MTFRERHYRLSRLTILMAALAIIPFLLNLLDVVQLTAAGLLLYTLILLAVGGPALVMSVQHARALHRGEGK